jgi:acyl carrier protein
MSSQVSEGGPPLIKLSTRTEIESWLVAQIAREAKMSPDSVGPNMPFAKFGLDSIVIVTLVDELEEKIGASLDPTIFWEFPTIAELASWLVKEKITARSGE